MWKPGQIVTLGGKKYRLKRSPIGCDCSVCDHYYTPESLEPCRTCLYGRRMPYNCRLQEIKPKSVMG